MLREASFNEIYIACGYTDLRKGIDGLAAWIQQQFDLNPHRTGSIFSVLRKEDRQDQSSCMGRRRLSAFVQTSS